MKQEFLNSILHCSAVKWWTWTMLQTSTLINFLASSYSHDSMLALLVYSVFNSHQVPSKDIAGENAE